MFKLFCLILIASNLNAYSIDAFLENVSLNCKNSIDCENEKVGVLFGINIQIKSEEDLDVNYNHCTAWLDSNLQLVSNSHCIKDLDKKYFYITKKAIYPIKIDFPKSNSFKSEKYDIAFFNFENKKPQTIGYNISSEINSSDLKVLSVNDISAEDDFPNIKYEIEPKFCKIYDKNLYFPYEFTGDKKLSNLYDCDSINGNSGSPILQKNNVLGILFEGSMDGMMNPYRGGLEIFFNSYENLRGKGIISFHPMACALSQKCEAINTEDQIKYLEQIINEFQVKMNNELKPMERGVFLIYLDAEYNFKLLFLTYQPCEIVAKKTFETPVYRVQLLANNKLEVQKSNEYVFVDVVNEANSNTQTIQGISIDNPYSYEIWSGDVFSYFELNKNFIDVSSCSK